MGNHNQQYIMVDYCGVTLVILDLLLARLPSEQTTNDNQAR